MKTECPCQGKIKGKVCHIESSSTTRCIGNTIGMNAHINIFITLLIIDLSLKQKAL